MRISDWSSDVCSSDLGFAEVTPSRCTVLAEEALPVGEIDRAKAEQRLSDAKDDLLDAKDATEKAVAERQIKVAERSEEHTSELQSLMRISYAVFCLKKKKTKQKQQT